MRIDAPDGSTASNATSMSSMLPYRSRTVPAARVATQPPTVERLDRLREVAHRVAGGVELRLEVVTVMPACTRAVQRRLVDLERCVERAQIDDERVGRGSTPPQTPEPAPNGTTGKRCWFA